MSLIRKEYFRLDEVIDDLGLSGTDVLYLAETGQLRLSVRVFSLMLESGILEEIDVNDWQSFPDETVPHSGLLELRERDAHEVLKTGATEGHCFHAPPGRYLCRPDHASTFPVQARDLLIRDTELQRLKALVGHQPAETAAPASSNPCPGFVHSPDYRMVQIAGEVRPAADHSAAQQTDTRATHKRCAESRAAHLYKAVTHGSPELPRAHRIACCVQCIRPS